MTDTPQPPDPPSPEELDRRYHTFRRIFSELTNILNGDEAFRIGPDSKINHLFLEACIVQELTHISWALDQLLADNYKP